MALWAMSLYERQRERIATSSLFKRLLAMTLKLGKQSYLNDLSVNNPEARQVTPYYFLALSRRYYGMILLAFKYRSSSEKTQPQYFCI